jgi:hypothetical protein
MTPPATIGMPPAQQDLGIGENPETLPCLLGKGGGAWSGSLFPLYPPFLYPWALGRHRLLCSVGSCLGAEGGPSLGPSLVPLRRRVTRGRHSYPRGPRGVPSKNGGPPPAVSPPSVLLPLFPASATPPPISRFPPGGGGGCSAGTSTPGSPFLSVPIELVVAFFLPFLTGPPRRGGRGAFPSWVPVPRGRFPARRVLGGEGCCSF